MSTIDKPSHYAPVGGVYPIDISERLPHCLGAALEYLWRAGIKAGQPAGQDYRKAAWYLRRLAADTQAPWLDGMRVRVDPVAAAMAGKAHHDSGPGAKSNSTLQFLLLISTGTIPVSALTVLAGQCEHMASSAESGQ